MVYSLRFLLIFLCIHLFNWLFLLKNYYYYFIYTLIIYYNLNINILFLVAIETFFITYNDFVKI